MYTSVIIHNNKTENIKTNYFKISLNFYLGHGDYQSFSIETTEHSEVITLANDLNNLDQWFKESAIDTLINSSLLKEHLVFEIFEMEDDGQEIRFDNEEGDFSIIWIDEHGRQCSVELR